MSLKDIWDKADNILLLVDNVKLIYAVYVYYFFSKGEIKLIQKPLFIVYNLYKLTQYSGQTGMRVMKICKDNNKTKQKRADWRARECPSGR
jgi:hypothetical protein